MGPESGGTATVCTTEPNAQGFSSSISSGGGFSIVYERPAWQTSAVDGYFSSARGILTTSGYNTTGRGYPDISSLANKYKVYIGGNAYTLSGTSAASPVMAGLFALINAQRKRSGASALGWITPSLYQMSTSDAASIYKDITLGTNTCT